MPRISQHRLIALAASFALCGISATAAPQEKPSAKPPQKAAANKQKEREIPHAPVSELIRRILAEEARLDTAQRLARTASTPDEVRLAQKAVRIADHELDLTFLGGLRRAADESTPATPEARALQDRVNSLQGELEQQHAVVDKLKKQTAAARGRRKDSLQGQLELEQAKLELSNDELADAREDLINAGGDLKTQIERMQAEHEAAEQLASKASAQAGPAPGSQTSDTLFANGQAWFQLRGLSNQLEAALEDALAAVDTLKERQAEFEKQAGINTPPPAQAPTSAGPGASNLDAIRQQSRVAKIQAGYKLRMRDLTELATTYQKWGDLVGARERVAGRAVLVGLLWIALIFLVAFGANLMMQRILLRVTQERRRLHTLRTLSRFALQAVTLALVLLVVLGPPSQLATLVAFAGAGLTVALKDFIVSFIGWFMLMGSNGVHVGDWVEINGVCGEVVEVSLFHTVLLETGNWTDPGHPTGRKVTFTNSYAIEGHHFNFSTSGQWLWDELQVLIPRGKSPHALADGILRMVIEETQANQQLAEAEWQKLAPPAHGPRTLSAAPVVMVQPSGSGITARVRYITRANERFDLRARLYHNAVDILQGENARKFTEDPAERQL
jgi:small-conductance mechanosensitive channel/histone H3/H4